MTYPRHKGKRQKTGTEPGEVIWGLPILYSSICRHRREWIHSENNHWHVDVFLAAIGGNRPIGSAALIDKQTCRGSTVASSLELDQLSFCLVRSRPFLCPFVFLQFLSSSFLLLLLLSSLTIYNSYLLLRNPFAYFLFFIFIFSRLSLQIFPFYTFFLYSDLI